jgi:ribosome biogenesis GTPase
MEANFCRVDLDAPGPAGQRQLLCTCRARLAKGGLAICVGDRVEVEGIDWVQQRGAIGRRGPRINLLPRPAVANVTRAVVVVSLKEPEPDPLQITRFLLSAEHLAVPVDLVLSKADTLPQGWLEGWCQRLQTWGYSPLPVSTRTGLGLQALAERLAQPGIAVLCGPSGVGKSSLLNALVPGLALRVAPVSGRLQRGRHTTRHVELVALPGAPEALLADTPGFNRPGLPSSPSELVQCFPARSSTASAWPRWNPGLPFRSQAAAGKRCCARPPGAGVSSNSMGGSAPETWKIELQSTGEGIHALAHRGGGEVVGVFESFEHGCFHSGLAFADQGWLHMNPQGELVAGQPHAGPPIAAAAFQLHGIEFLLQFLGVLLDLLGLAESLGELTKVGKSKASHGARVRVRECSLRVGLPRPPPESPAA